MHDGLSVVHSLDNTAYVYTKVAHVGQTTALIHYLSVMHLSKWYRGRILTPAAKDLPTTLYICMYSVVLCITYNTYVCMYVCT